MGRQLVNQSGEKKPLVSIWTWLFLGILAVAASLTAPSSADAAVAALTGNGWRTTAGTAISATAYFRGTTAAPGATNTYTIAAGTNRLLVVALSLNYSATNSTYAPTVKYGSTGAPNQTLTLATSDQGSVSRQHTWIFYLKEAGIAAANGSNLQFTYTGTAPTFTGTYANAAVYTGVDQTTPYLTPTTYNQLTTANTTVGPLGTSQVVASGNIAIEMLNCLRTASSTAATITLQTGGWTSQNTTTRTGTNYAATFYVLANSTANTFTSQHTASNSVVDSMSALTLKAGGITVGAGSTVTAPSPGVYAGDTDVVVDSFTLSGTGTVTDITVTGTGNATSSYLSGFKIWKKNDTNYTTHTTGGATPDTQIGSGTFGATAGAVNATLTQQQAVSALQSYYLITYDIKSTAIANGSNITFGGYVTATTPVSSTNGDNTATTTHTLRATTTLGDTTEQAYKRLAQNGDTAIMDVFTLKHNGTSTADDDTISTVVVNMLPATISGGTGGITTKIEKLEVVTDDGAGGYTVIGSKVHATSADQWNIPTPTLKATSTLKTYYIRLTTATGFTNGWYTGIGGTVSSSLTVHDNANNRFSSSDGASQSFDLDTEAPNDPSFTATKGSKTDQPGGKIDLSWTVASTKDPNGGDLNSTTPYLVVRGPEGGTNADLLPKCTNGTPIAISNALTGTVQVSGLNDTSAPTYFFRICAVDKQGNISDGVQVSARSSYTNYCHNAPTITVGSPDPKTGLPQEQIVRSDTGGNPINIRVTNMDIGDCDNYNFNISVTRESGTESHFSKSYASSILLGPTAGAGSTNKMSGNIPLTINGITSAGAQQLDTYKFHASVQEVNHNGNVAVNSDSMTVLINDMPPIVHNSANMAKFVYGTWGNNYTCATCHSNSTTNIKGIFELISTPIGKRRVVFNTTSANSSVTSGVFGNDNRPVKNGSTNVCEVCHHQTIQHQYSSNLSGHAGPPDPITHALGTSTYEMNHNNNEDCTRCHTHNTAFRSIFGRCGDCHGDKFTGYAPVDKGSMVKDTTLALGTAPETYGAHKRHNNEGITCQACHSNSNHAFSTDGTYTGNNSLQMGFYIYSGSYPGFNPTKHLVGGVFSGVSSLNSPFFWEVDSGTTLNRVSDTNASCNTYCHGSWANNNSATPNWTTAGQAGCGTCHPATPSVPPTVGSHKTHAGNDAKATIAQLSLACSKCHGGYGNFSGHGHINGNVEWNLTAYAGAKYNGYSKGSTGAPAPTDSGNYGNCTNLYCHSNVQGADGIGAPTYFSPKWGGTVVCGDCHVNPNNTGGHLQHETSGYNFDCHDCHNNGGYTSPLNHANGVIDLQFAGLAEGTNYVLNGVQKTVVTPGSGYGICTNSNCHGRSTRQWGPKNDAIPLCDKCHGTRTSARGFYNTFGPDGTLSIYSAGIGVHDIHLQNLNSPRKSSFSRFTSFAAGMNCNQCHHVPNSNLGPSTPGHVDSAVPAEIVMTLISSIAQKGQGTLYKYSDYSTATYTNGVCSSVWCHGAGMASNRGYGKYAGTTPNINRKNPNWYAPVLTGDPQNDCKVCHGYPPPAPDSSYTHYNKQPVSCKTCHTHMSTDGYGFENKSLHINGKVDGGCNSCHGNPPTTSDIGTADGIATPAQNAIDTVSGPGAHEKHEALYPGNCDTCHYQSNQAMPSNNLEIGFNGINGAFRGGTFTGYTNTVNGPKWLSSDPSYTNIVKSNVQIAKCSNIYCHGDGNSYATPVRPALGGATGNGTKPDWQVPARCGDCHGTDNLNYPSGGSHAKHLLPNIVTCDGCHGPTADDGKHVDAAVSWALDRTSPLYGPNATYNGMSAGSIAGLAPRYKTVLGDDYKTCANIYCHSTVQSGTTGTGGPTYKETAVWGTSGGAACGTCHANFATALSLYTTTGSHLKHANTTSGMGIVCGYCHQDGGTTTAIHADGMTYVNFTSFVGGSYNSGTSYNAGGNNPNGKNQTPQTGFSSCAATFCHGAGSSPAWGTPGPLACNTCHGANLNDATWGGRHNTHYNYTTLLSSYNMVTKDLSSSTKYRFNCANCHDDNIAKHSLKPASSRAAARVFFAISAATPSTASKRGIYSYGGVKAGSDNGFNFTSGICNTTYCHSNGRGGLPLNTFLHWTTTKTTGSNCKYCHDNKSTTGTASALSPKHDRHMNPTNNTFIGAGNGFNCVDCHAQTVFKNLSVGDKSKHINAILDYSGAKANKNYNSATKICSNVYCHSNGNPNATVFVSMTGYKVWGASTFYTITTCNKCHGRTTTLGMPDYANGGSGQATANLHFGHMSSLRTTARCADCHRKTPDAMYPNKFRPYSTLHMSGSPNINFDFPKAYIGANATITKNGSVVTCSNIVCHGQGAPVWGASNTIGTCQKCHGSKGTAFATVSSPQVAPGYGSDGTDTSMIKKLPTDPRVGAHQRHLLTDAISTPIKCSECHVTVTSMRSANHWNLSTATLTFSGRATGNGHSTPTFSRNASGAMVCNNTYCHTGRSNTGNFVSPYFNYTGLLNEGALTVDACNRCHGFPPKGTGVGGTALTFDHSGIADPVTFPVTTCACHSNLNKNGTNFTNVFADKSLHVNGTIDVDKTHVYPFKGYSHMRKAGNYPYNGCTGCHTVGSNTTYPVSRGTAPDCTGCHIKGLLTPVGTSSCYDCHGSSNISGAPNGNVFPNTSGSHNRHVTENGISCETCHINGTGKPKHGNYSGVVRTFAVVTSTTNQFNFSKSSGHTCSNVACHSGTADWYLDKGKPVSGCLGCHASVANNDRAAITGQFSFNSHHIQNGEELTNAQCYNCHWEANSDGTVNKQYHGGSNSTKALQSGVGVHLVVWNTTSRPTTLTPGATYISYTANGSRAQIAKLDTHCMSCHSTPNQGVKPFGVYSTVRYSPEASLLTPKIKSSVQSRYSSSRVVTWSLSNYSSPTGAVARYGANRKNRVTKALSAHGNAIKNQFPQWDDRAKGNGDDAYLNVDSSSSTLGPNRNVHCYDCHNSHGSSAGGASGLTSSYSSATGRNRGGLLKTTTNGIGGYTVDYTPAARTVVYKQYSAKGTISADINSGASICNDCHNNDSDVSKGNNIPRPWSITGTYSSLKPIVGYWSTPYFDNYTVYSTKRTIYKAGGAAFSNKDLRKPMGGHFGTSINGDSVSDLSKHPNGPAADHGINGLCTPCHDPHGVSGTLGASGVGPNNKTGKDLAVPLLKGTWVTSPYREDKADVLVKRGGGCSWTGIMNGGAAPGYHIDQNTFLYAPNPVNSGAAKTTAKANMRAQSFRSFNNSSSAQTGTNMPNYSAYNSFAGICMECHSQLSLSGTASGRPTAASAWKTKERIHQSVTGWAASTSGGTQNVNNAKHAYTCAKCHAPHVSRLPRLLVTNCLDVRHFGQRISNGSIAATANNTTTPGNINQTQNTSSAQGAGRFPGGGSRYSNTLTTSQNPGPWWFQTNGTAGTTQPTNFPMYGGSSNNTCHNAPGAGGATYAPTNQLWNNKTQW